ncbi:MAG: HupE/UreJ family protein [Novosphingobium sp.]
MRATTRLAAAAETTARRLSWLLAALVLALLAQPAAAHLTPNSEVRLRFEPGAMRVAVLIPVAEFAFATGRPANDRPQTRATLSAYLLDHTRAASPDGRAWRVAVDDVRVEPAPGGPDILATLTYTAPVGAPDRRLTLAWDAVIREGDSHFALVSVDGDLSRGIAHGNDLIGSFTSGRTSIAIDRGATGHGALFAGALRVGAHHILAGHDHLLFLLALLLPAPLLAVGGRWRGVRPLADTLRRLAWVVTAFTVGHSATLIAAALFNARLPTAPVEAAIALSVLVSAIHAMRPLFPGREPWVAFAFGLVHGLAFATVIAGFGVGIAARTTAILGFNLGIELVQLAIVALLLPALLIAARRPGYATRRLVLAGVAAAAALAWLVERVSGVANPLADAFAAALPALGLALVAASLLAGAVWLVGWRTAVAGAAHRA